MSFLENRKSQLFPDSFSLILYPGANPTQSQRSDDLKGGGFFTRIDARAFLSLYPTLGECDSSIFSLFVICLLISNEKGMIATLSCDWSLNLRVFDPAKLLQDAFELGANELTNAKKNNFLHQDYSEVTRNLDTQVRKCNDFLSSITHQVIGKRHHNLKRNTR